MHRIDGQTYLRIRQCEQPAYPSAGLGRHAQSQRLHQHHAREILGDEIAAWLGI